VEKYNEGEEGKEERKEGRECGGAVLDGKGNIKRALTIVSGDDRLTTAVGDAGTIGDDGLEWIIGRDKELLDILGLSVLVFTLVDDACKELKVDDIIVKVVETIAVGDPPLIEQEGLLISAETTNVRVAIGIVLACNGVVDGEIGDGGARTEGLEDKVGRLGLEDEGELADKVVDAEGGKESIETHDNTDAIVGEACGRVLGCIVCRSATCACNVSREGECILVAHKTLLEGLGEDHTVGTDVETLSSSGRGLTSAAGVAA